MTDTQFDLVVIGAGWYGLPVAATYLQLHPHANVLVLEAKSTIGGVWSQERQYPDLRSNNMLGTYEYPDFPMDTETYGVKPGEHIPGQVVHRYLSNYAKKTGVSSRIRFDTQVLEASKDRDNEGWVLKTDNYGLTRILTKKLVLATGLTSEPNMPSFVSEESFKKSGLLIHFIDFNAHIDKLVAQGTPVTVLGSSKSAWDIAYACATRNLPVNLVIRTSGHGPSWMVHPYVTPFKLWLEGLAHTRLLTWLSPCIWGDEDGYSYIRSFLHSNWLGRKLTDAFWWVLSDDASQGMGYDKHAETKKLKPRHSAFWTGSGLGIMNFEIDFLGLVREGKVRVYNSDVESLDEGSMTLANGTTLNTKAIICATGWKATPPLTFSPPGLSASLGLPSSSTPDFSTIDAEILSRFPKLKDQPDVPKPGGDTTPDATNSPFLLYRFMAPPSSLLSDPSIAFAGMMAPISTSTCASIQALWICAHLSSSLSRLPTSAASAQESAILHARFGRWRYPCGYGARFPDFVFDAIPYLDMLMRDLGLQGKRKGSWWREVVQAYGPEDYRGVVEEWREGQKAKLDGGESKKSV
ncbi:dimethylaniline monooxygenase (N-oxide forming) [Aureobasidium subglaciale]|nr:dimethylaniline monooxygenase (N-oxide forming) [Aureobasidium subglaciale]